MRRYLKDPVVIIGLIVAIVAVVVGVTLAARANGSGDLADSEGVIELADVDELSSFVGHTVSAAGARVQSVPADEGFWIAEGFTERLWVQIDTVGESPPDVDAGDQVGFTGVVVAHDADYVASRDLSAADAEDLADAGAHIEVDVDDLTLG